MLGELLGRLAKDRGSVIAVDDGHEPVTYAALGRLMDTYATAGELRKGARIGVAIAHPASFIAAVAALDAAGADSFLIGSRDRPDLDALGEKLGLDAVWTADAPSPGPRTTKERDPRRTGSVTLLTSGTTGEPKMIGHSWETLARPARRDPALADTRWLCAYPLRLYAGTQVLLQALINGATIVVPVSPDPATVARLVARARVTHASGTPTFWRQVCLFGDRQTLRKADLRQLTLGGEAVDQALLEMVGGTFPGARIVHIYASTELGRLFSVTDGREGFPAAYLEKVPGGGVQLEIRDGELFAKSTNAMLGQEGWRATGDMVHLLDDRVLFRGRRSDIINVGGSKVSPLKVEAVLRRVDGVADLRVYPKRSSLAGELVACDVVVMQGFESSSVKTALLATARSVLSPAEVPRIVGFVERIDATTAFKVARGEPES